jgi:hypothetical protein
MLATKARISCNVILSCINSLEKDERKHNKHWLGHFLYQYFLIIVNGFFDRNLKGDSKCSPDGSNFIQNLIAKQVLHLSSYKFAQISIQIARRLNRHFGPQTMPRCLFQSLNYQKGQFSP